MRPTTYTTSVLQDYEKMLAATGHIRNKNSFKRISKLYMSLASSIKFRLPDGGQILGIEPKDAFKCLHEFGRLPYQKTSIEYFVDFEPDHFLGAGAPIAAKERVLLCEQIDDHSIMMALFFIDCGIWTPFEGILFFDTRNQEAVTIGLVDETVFKGWSEQQIGEHLSDNYNDEVTILADFLTALSCRNVSQHDVPSPIYINKKRHQKGKVPLFAYKELVLDTVAVSSRGIETGNRSSPRVHLRRGHIRRQPNGNIWINAAVVGDKSRGMVHKHYKLKAALQ